MNKVWGRRIIECISIVILCTTVKCENVIESCLFSEVSGFCRNGSGKFLPRKSNVPTLYIIQCDMTSLIAEDFSGYSSLTDLHLHNTSLPIPPSQASVLAKLPGLQSLEITDIEVKENHFNELIHVPNLRDLTLRWTNLTRINKVMFVHVRKLQTINFSYNEISEIEEGVFDHLPELQKIDLSYNQIGWDFNPSILFQPNGCFSCVSQITGESNQILLPSSNCQRNAVDELWRFAARGGDIRLERNPVCWQIESGDKMDALSEKPSEKGDARDACALLSPSIADCPGHRDRCQFLLDACAATSAARTTSSRTGTRHIRSAAYEKHDKDGKKDRTPDHGGKDGSGSHEDRHAGGGWGWNPKSWGAPPPGWVAPTGLPPPSWRPPPWGPPRWGPPGAWGPPGYPPGQWYPGYPGYPGYYPPKATPAPAEQDSGKEEMDMEGAKGVIGGAGTKKTEDSDDTSVETLPPSFPKAPAAPKATVAPPPVVEKPEFETSEEAEPVAKPGQKTEPPERQTVQKAGTPTPSPKRGLLVPLVCAAAGVAVLATIVAAVCVVKARRRDDARRDFQESMKWKREDPDGGGEDEFEEVLLRAVDVKTV